MIAKLGPGFTIQRRKFRLGRPLGPNETSRSGLYALTTYCGHPLRISLFRDAANLMCDWESRTLWECFPHQD